ncbi:hypothetical protein RHGRI_016124 [Rhododendron griersonianum]|uniref:Uncharacterized protein n=1 Tax=Rhododendron griersonianum TaxID=479676 RepID=A0AAV6JTF0_9ERIC|nr:hypothetical protein RHGRI_016124 [Rhododendron griersonianum]
MCTISPHFGRCPWLFRYKLQIKSWPTSITNEGKSWNQRIQISIDVANRLNYHHSSTKPVYERKDVESSKGMEAAIANEGRELLLSMVAGSTMEVEDEESEMGSMIDPRLFGNGQT